MLLPTRTRSHCNVRSRCFVGSARARNGETPVKFLLNHGRIFEQPNHFGPDGLIQELLPNTLFVWARNAVPNRSARKYASDVAPSCATIPKATTGTRPRRPDRHVGRRKVAGH
jgi:hypothetical protein